MNSMLRRPAPLQARDGDELEEVESADELDLAENGRRSMAASRQSRWVGAHAAQIEMFCNGRTAVGKQGGERGATSKTKKERAEG